jgi:hypothetical protein
LPTEFRGRVCVLTLSAEQIRVSGIRFYGREIPAVRAAPPAERADRQVCVTARAARKAVRKFVAKEVAQEIAFERPVLLMGLRFPDISLVGRLIVMEVKNAGRVSLLHLALAEARPTKNVPVHFTVPIEKTSMKVWYSRVGPQALAQLTNDQPVPLILQGD